MLRLIPSYTEVSPSNTGFKIFFLVEPGDMPALLKALGMSAEGKQL